MRARLKTVIYTMALFIALTSAAAHAELRVVGLCGSTREGSFNRALLNAAAAIAREKGATVTVVDLKNYPMPFYDGDLEAQQGMPESAKKLRRLLIQSDVILISSPEYNHSVSAVLKNTIDWLSRGEQGGASREAFKGKKVILMATSPGRGGAARGLTHLQQIIADVGGTVMEPSIAVPSAHSAFDEKGRLKDPEAIKQLRQRIEGEGEGTKDLRGKGQRT